jgi:hypothetical protein
MLNVITFSVTGDLTAAAGEDDDDGPPGAASCPHADVDAAAAANSRAVVRIRTSTAIANRLPANKEEQAGALQRMTP